MPGLDEVIANSIAAARDEGVVAESADTGDIEASSSGDGDGVEADIDVSATAEASADSETASADVKDTTGAAEIPDKDVKADETPADDSLAKELGLKPRPDGKMNRLPFERVEKITANAKLKSAQAVVDTVAGLLGITAEPLTHETRTPEALKTRLTTMLGDVTALREKVKGMNDLEPIMEYDADNFVRILASSNPRYKKFLTVIDTPAKEDKTSEAAEPVFDAKRPEADIEYELDGKKVRSYSPAGVEALMEWYAARIEHKLGADVSKRVAPIESERRTREQEREFQVKMGQYTTAVLEEARSWDGFKDHEVEIQAALVEFPNEPAGRALQRAYEKVVIAKYKADAEAGRTQAATVRQQVLDELKRAPESTTVTTGATVPRREIIRDEEGFPVDPTEAVIRKALEEAKAKGIK